MSISNLPLNQSQMFFKLANSVLESNSDPTTSTGSNLKKVTDTATSFENIFSNLAKADDPKDILNAFLNNEPKTQDPSLLNELFGCNQQTPESTPTENNIGVNDVLSTALTVGKVAMFFI